MTRVTYTHVQRGGGVRALVILDGREVGTIRANRSGFFYRPREGRPGPAFPTIGGVKREIERRGIDAP